MKQIIIILSTLLTLILTGVLYGTHGQPEEVEAVRAEQVWMHQFPDQMPNFIPDPMVGYPLY